MSSDTAVHPYFLDKARGVIAAAGGDPDTAGALAAWAEAARAMGDSRRGVIIDQAGEVLADTEYRPPRAAADVGATYATSGGPGVENVEMGLAMGALRRRTGRGVIHVKYSQVCTGPGRKAHA